MITATIDLNLVDLVEQYTQLRKVSGREYAGACPSCGGTDRLHVVDDQAGAWWFCRQCAPYDDKKRHDLASFLALVGDRPPAPAPRAPAPRARTATTSTTLTQGQAVELVDRAIRRLEVDDAAVAYLAQRGITSTTASAWWLGSALVWNRDARCDLPAIVLPWINADIVTGVKYRFLSGTQRYTSRKVDDHRFPDNVFGRQTFTGAYDLLVVVEGELNAVSVWQAARGLGWRHLDVISVGAQDGIRARALADIVCDFRRVILWADDAKVVTSGRQAAPAALALQSPTIDGVKWDANAQLMTGALDDFLITIMSKL